jgi:HEAT repeat protein
MRPGWSLWWCALVLTAVGCRPDVAATKGRAARLLDAASIDSARVLVSGLARRCPSDTGVLALQVRLYSAERRVREATDVLRQHDSLAGAHDPVLLVQVLGAVLGGGDIGCAINTIRACGELAAEPMYSAVEAALDDREPYVRRAAVYAIPRYHRNDAVEALATAILDDDPMVRAEMLKSAARLGDKRMLDLTRVLQIDPNDGVGWCFVNMRAALGDKQMRAQVRTELAGDYQILKVDAATTLARLGEKQQLPVLAEGLRSDEECTRATAARALGDLKAGEYLDTLLAAVADTAEFVREEITYALGEMGDTRALPVLRRLAREASPRVRGSAVVAMARLGEPEETIASALRDSSLDVRAAAATALLAIQKNRQAAR